MIIMHKIYYIHSIMPLSNDHTDLLTFKMVINEKM